MATDRKKHSAAVDDSPFRDLTKTFEQLKLPGVGMSSIFDANRKDVEALAAANQMAFEALQGLARTQTDMLTQAMQSAQALASGQRAAGQKPVDAVRYTEAAQKSWQKMLVDMKALAEMAQKSQTEAMAGLTERATETLGMLQGSASHLK